MPDPVNVVFPVPKGRDPEDVLSEIMETGFITIPIFFGLFSKKYRCAWGLAMKMNGPTDIVDR